MTYGPDTIGSDSIGELAAALATAQSTMQPAAKSAKNPHLGGSYSDLASCIEAGKEPLTAAGLSVTQIITGHEPMVLVTMLMHSSGEYLQSCVPIVSQAQKGINDAQALGSAITYMRRYAYQAIIGQPSADDDGASAGASRDTDAPTQPATADTGAGSKCPKCGAAAIIKGQEQYGGGWICWKKQGGCGAKFSQHPDTMKPTQPGEAGDEMTDEEIQRFRNGIADMTFDLGAEGAEALLVSIGTTMDEMLKITGRNKAREVFQAVKAATEKPAADVPPTDALDDSLPFE